MSYITLKDELKVYGEGHSATVANDHVSFSVEEGEFVVILGPSGAGKSTILNILGGMDKPTSGEVWVAGTNIATYNEKELTTYRRHHVGFVFQFYNLLPNLTTKENVEMSEQIAKEPLKAEEILQKVGLGKRLDNFPSQLSGGEQQRVSIARAIAKNPDLLLCDEPTGALDNETGKQILELLQRESTERGKTVIVITHNPLIAQMGDRVIVVKNGKIAEERLQEHKKVDEVEWSK